MTKWIETAQNGHREEEEDEEEEEWDENEEWEWETESEDEAINKKAESKPGVKKPQPNIQIEGSLVKIDRKQPVDWSEDEFDDDDDYSIPKPPPPPPPPPPSDSIPQPPPPPSKKRTEALDNLKKKPAKTPDWNDLMKEIGTFRYGHKHLLNKVICNDRSNPVLTKTKVEGQFVFDSEKTEEKKDILKDIQKGVRLKHVKTNDRSKPNLRGIRNFRRQNTKEEGQIAEAAMDALDENEEFIKLRDDLESTKQLLELEIRSKSLLEKDNKRLQLEMEKIRAEMKRASNDEVNGDGDNNEPPSRKSSIQMKRRSLIRMISENEALMEEEPNDLEAEDELLRQEAEEAKLLAEEWENKYKEMQRQMKDIEGGGKHHHHKKSSTVSEPGFLDGKGHEDESQYDSDRGPDSGDEGDDEDWMSKREIHSLKQKLKTVHDKREILNRERKLLNERIETLIASISSEVESRQKLKKEIKDMNEAFKREIAEMCAEELNAAELEDCYYSDDEKLVSNTHNNEGKAEEDWEDEEPEYEEEEEETLSEIIQLAEDELEEEEIKEFEGLFDLEKESAEVKAVKERLETLSQDKESSIEFLNSQIESQTTNVHNMRKSNFSIKSKIDRLHDVLQYEKERHQDLKQELTRMLADIQ